MTTPPIVTTAAVGVRAQTSGSAGISSSGDRSFAELCGGSGRRFPGAAPSPSGGFTVLQSLQQGTRGPIPPVPCHIRPDECEVMSYCGFGLCFLPWTFDPRHWGPEETTDEGRQRPFQEGKKWAQGGPEQVQFEPQGKEGDRCESWSPGEVPPGTLGSNLSGGRPPEFCVGTCAG